MLKPGPHLLQLLYQPMQRLQLLTPWRVPAVHQLLQVRLSHAHQALQGTGSIWGWLAVLLQQLLQGCRVVSKVGFEGLIAGGCREGVAQQSVAFAVCLAPRGGVQEPDQVEAQGAAEKANMRSLD